MENLMLWGAMVRPHHWIKSGFCLCGLLFSGKFVYVSAWLDILPLLAGMSLLASAGYMVNDVLNAKEDSRHPRKWKRPIAMGRIGRGSVLIGALVLAVLGAVILAWAYLWEGVGMMPQGEDGANRAWAFWAGLAYLPLTIGYSLLFRKVIVWDILVLGFGFVLRVVAGAYAVGVHPSGWLLLCTYVLAMLLGYGKRLGECRYLEEKGRNIGETRAVLRSYSPEFLTLMVVLCACLAGGLYVAYCLQREDRLVFLWTAAPVMLGLTSYIRIASRSGEAESPEVLFLRSPFFLGSVLGWLAMVAAIIAKCV